jgi:hypothetical protein
MRPYRLRQHVLRDDKGKQTILWQVVSGTGKHCHVYSIPLTLAEAEQVLIRLHLEQREVQTDDRTDLRSETFSRSA